MSASWAHGNGRNGAFVSHQLLNECLAGWREKRYPPRDPGPRCFTLSSVPAFEGGRGFLCLDTIYADEAWTHQSKPLRRYWCFYGGMFGTEGDLGRLDVALRRCLADRGVNGEVKWARVAPHNVAKYRAFTDCLFDDIERGRVRWRQMFCDRAYVRVPSPNEAPVTDLDVQFKLCYQFLKHSFGLEYLEAAVSHEVLVRLDTHSSQNHKQGLIKFAEDLPRVLQRPRLRVRVTFDNSENVPRIQVCDLLIGAAGSYGNCMHKMRDGGRRGMSDKQKARLELCEHVYKRLRAIDASARGSRAFNWFESTGRDGDRSNMLAHPLRIWKFKPMPHLVDAGWHRDHLGPAGEDMGPDLRPADSAAD